jgi:hypothetical protein
LRIEENKTKAMIQTRRGRHQTEAANLHSYQDEELSTFT